MIHEQFAVWPVDSVEPHSAGKGQEKGCYDHVPVPYHTRHHTERLQLFKFNIVSTCGIMYRGFDLVPLQLQAIFSWFKYCSQIPNYGNTDLPGGIHQGWINFLRYYRYSIPSCCQSIGLTHFSRENCGQSIGTAQLYLFSNTYRWEGRRQNTVQLHWRPNQWEFQTLSQCNNFSACPSYRRDIEPGSSPSGLLYPSPDVPGKYFGGYWKIIVGVWRISCLALPPSIHRLSYRRH